MDGTLRLTLLPAKDLLTGPLEHWHYDTWRWDNADPSQGPSFLFDTDHQVTGFTMDQHSPDFQLSCWTSGRVSVRISKGRSAFLFDPLTFR